MMIIIAIVVSFLLGGIIGGMAIGLLKGTDDPCEICPLLRDETESMLEDKSKP